MVLPDYTTLSFCFRALDLAFLQLSHLHLYLEYCHTVPCLFCGFVVQDLAKLLIIT